MHVYFDGYIHSMSTLKQFVEQYEIALSDEIQKEFDVDYDNKQKKILCILEFTQEKVFQRAFTNVMYLEV